VGVRKFLYGTRENSFRLENNGIFAGPEYFHSSEEIYFDHQTTD